MKNNYVETANTLTTLFNEFNKKFYQNKLPKCIITLQQGKKSNALGWFTTSAVWKADGETYHEINISCDFLDREPILICETLLHEMVHFYNSIHDLKDCNASQYHNKNFQKGCEKVGLVCEYSTRYGYDITRLSDATRAYLETLDLSGITCARIPTGNEVRRRNTSKKYMCPCCKQIIRSNTYVDIICATCNEDFALVK